MPVGTTGNPSGTATVCPGRRDVYKRQVQELSLNILDIAENSVKAGAALVTVGVCYRPSQDRLLSLIHI